MMGYPIPLSPDCGFAKHNAKRIAKLLGELQAVFPPHPRRPWAVPVLRLVAVGHPPRQFYPSTE